MNPDRAQNVQFLRWIRAQLERGYSGNLTLHISQGAIVKIQKGEVIRLGNVNPDLLADLTEEDPVVTN